MHFAGLLVCLAGVHGLALRSRAARWADPPNASLLAANGSAAQTPLHLQDTPLAACTDDAVRSFSMSSTLQTSIMSWQGQFPFFPVLMETGMTVCQLTAPASSPPTALVAVQPKLTPGPWFPSALWRIDEYVQTHRGVDALNTDEGQRYYHAIWPQDAGSPAGVTRCTLTAPCSVVVFLLGRDTLLEDADSHLWSKSTWDKILRYPLPASFVGNQDLRATTRTVILIPLVFKKQHGGYNTESVASVVTPVVKTFLQTNPNVNPNMVSAVGIGNGAAGALCLVRDFPDMYDVVVASALSPPGDCALTTGSAAWSLQPRLRSVVISYGTKDLTLHFNTVAAQIRTLDLLGRKYGVSAQVRAYDTIANYVWPLDLEHWAGILPLLVPTG